MRRSVLNALVLAALVLAAPVIDFVEWSRWRQGIQRRLDRAAIAQAESLTATGDVDLTRLGRIQPEAYGFTGAVRLESPPRTGAYAGRSDTVRLSVRAAHRPLFTAMVVGAVAVEVRATAGVRSTGQHAETRPVLLE